MNYTYEQFLNRFGDDLSIEELKWINKNSYINQPTYYGRLIELQEQFDINRYESEHIRNAYQYFLQLESGNIHLNILDSFSKEILLWFIDISNEFNNHIDDVEYIKNIVDAYIIIMGAFRYSVYFYPNGTDDYIKNSSWRYYRYPIIKDSSLEAQRYNKDINLHIRALKNFKERTDNYKSYYPFKFSVANAIRYAEVGKYQDALDIMNSEDNIGHSLLNYKMHIEWKLGKRNFDDLINQMPYTSAYKKGDYISNNYIANFYFHAYIFSEKKKEEWIDHALKLYKKNLDYYEEYYERHNRSKLFFDENGSSFTEPYYIVSLTLYPYLKYILLGNEFKE